MAFSHEGGPWMKTPSIVLSKASGVATGGVGGHNLNSAITEFRASTLVKPGEIRMVDQGGKRTLHYNPADVSRVGELTRAAALRKGDPNIAALLSVKLRLTERSIRVPDKALRLPKDVARSERRLVRAEKQITRQTAGWREVFGPRSADEFAANQATSSTHVPSIILEPWGTGFRVRNAANGISREAPTASSAVQILSDVMRVEAIRGNEIQIIAQGIQPRQMRLMIESANIQGARGQAQFQALLRSGKRPFAHSTDLLKRRYDWSKATVEPAPSRLITAGPRKGQYEHEFRVNVPSVQAGAPSLAMRILLYARSVLPETVARRLTQAIQTALSKSQRGIRASESTTEKGAALNLRETVSNIRKELKAVDPKLEKELRFEGEAGDLIIVEDLRRNGVGDGATPA